MKEEIKLFEDYLRAELSAEEIQAFELKLQNPEFKSRFEEYALVRDSIITAEPGHEEIKLRIKFEPLTEKYFKEKSSPKKLIFMESKFFAMRIAASVAFILVMSIGFLALNADKYNNSNLADKYFTKHGSYVTRSSEDAEKSRKIARDYHEANKLFQAGKHKLAVGLYNSMLFNNNPYKEYAEWNILMCRLKNDKKLDQDRLLKKILENPEHVMHQKALELDKDLNSFYRKLPF